MKNNSPFVGLLVTVIGIGFIIWGGMVVMEARSATNWPETQGTITSSRVIHTTSTSQTNKSKWYYRAEIKYGYEVDGLEYVSDRLDFGTYKHKYKSEVYPTGTKNRYPVGKSVTVYYDPIDPEQAVLDRQTGMNTYTGLLIGIITTIVGVLLFLRSGKEQ